MRKFLSIMVILLAFFVSFSTVSGAASVNPSSQVITGSSATANWTFSWDQSGSNIVRFNPGDGNRAVVWDSNNSAGYVPIFHTYYDQATRITYNPTFMAIKPHDGTTEGATATVEKRLR